MKTFKHPRTERKLKVEIQNMLNEAGAWYFMPVPTGMQAATLDFIGCYEGRFFAIETKRPGGVLTERQTICTQRIWGAKGYVIWGSDIDRIRTHFNLWASAITIEEHKRGESDILVR
jgi:hypothetical protein